MKLVLLVFGAFSFLISSCQSQGADPLSIIEENIIGMPDGTQLSIAVIENQNVNFYGLKFSNGSTQSIENHQKAFEIGSISKVFTSVLLAKLSIQGKLDLADPIANHLPFSLKKDAQMTFNELANHTSGLPRLPPNFEPNDPVNPYAHYDEKKLKSYLTEGMELIDHGTYYYSNVGYALLGYTLIQNAGKSYAELLDDHIFSKYNMPNSTTNRADVNLGLVKGLNAAGREIPNWDLNVFDPAGGILSTTEDLSKFVLAHFEDDNAELQLARNSTLTINHISSIGLGWEIINRKSGDVWYKHNGGTGGYTSAISINTKKKNGIVILSNVSDFSEKSGQIDDLCFSLMKALEQKE